MSGQPRFFYFLKSLFYICALEPCRTQTDNPSLPAKRLQNLPGSLRPPLTRDTAVCLSHSSRPPAWSTGARASPTFAPTSNTARSGAGTPTAPPGATQNSFPPLNQTNGARSDAAHEKTLQSLSGLTVRSLVSSRNNITYYSIGNDRDDYHEDLATIRRCRRFDQWRGRHHRGYAQRREGNIQPRPATQGPTLHRLHQYRHLDFGAC